MKREGRYRWQTFLACRCFADLPFLSSLRQNQLIFVFCMDVPFSNREANKYCIITHGQCISHNGGVNTPLWTIYTASFDRKAYTCFGFFLQLLFCFEFSWHPSGLDKRRDCLFSWSAFLSKNSICLLGKNDIHWEAWIGSKLSVRSRNFWNYSFWFFFVSIYASFLVCSWFLMW